MGRSFDAPEDVGGGGGQYLSIPGLYHCAVKEFRDGTGPKGNAMEGFSVQLECLDGTVREGGQCTEIGKVTNLMFNDGKETHKDGGKFCLKKQAAYYIATDVLRPDQLGQRVTIEPEDSVNRQVVVKLVHQDSDDEDSKKYLELSFCDIWHPDDPRAKDCPKNQDAMGLLPKELRHDESYFAPLLEKKPDSSKQPAASGSGVNFDDL